MKYAAFIAPLAIACTMACHQAENKKIGSDRDKNTSEQSEPVKESAKKEGEENKPQQKGGNWKIDAGSSSVNFTIKNFGKAVPGSIGGLSGSIDFDKDKPENAKFDASVQVKTINTDNKKRDDDLMADKYFNEGAHPAIRFVSKKVSKTANGYMASGDLTIKGITKPLDMPFSFEEKDGKGIFSSKFTINRHDFDIGGNGPIMGDDINVALKVAATK